MLLRLISCMEWKISLSFCLFSILIPLFTFGQVQIGSDLLGEGPGDQFGSSVSLSADGSILAVGAVGHHTSSNNIYGYVKIYENINGNWLQIGTDIIGEAQEGQFGKSVSLNSNGSIVAVGAPYNDGNGSLLYNCGHVRIYENINGDWMQIGSDIDGEAEWDASGFNLSLSADGSVVAIGSHNNDGNGDYSGHVRVYENINGNWIQIGSDIDGEAEWDVSGNSVSLNEDGSILAIGAPHNDGNGDDSGHVRVYENINGNWIQIGPDIDGENAGDRSGNSVSLNADGSKIAIGAYESSDNGLENAGHVRVYENIDDNWVQIGSDIDGENAGDFFGEEVSLSADGSKVAISAVYNDDGGLNSGYVKVFEYSNGTWINFLDNILGEGTGAQFGRSLSLSADGSKLSAGTPHFDFTGIVGVGHVRVFDLRSTLDSNEFLTIHDFKLFPNPADNQFNIQLADDIFLEQVNVLNGFGQTIITSKSKIINSSDYSSGLYFIEIITSKGKAIKRLIIDR